MENLRRAIGFSVALATILIYSVPLKAESPKADPIIISVTAPPALSDGGPVLSTSWSQAKPYTGVSISILVDSFIVGQTPTANAYLTTRISPGTTNADEIAHTQFTVPTDLPVCSPSSCGAMVTLFSGLGLGPGLFRHNESKCLKYRHSWLVSRAQSDRTARHWGSEGPSFFASAVASYPPANDFTPLNDAMNISVTGSVPFAGTPGKPNCFGQSVSALAQQFCGLNSAASALDFSSVQALHKAISEFCKR